MIMKRTTMPSFWPVERKTKKFVVGPMPGPHSKNKCISLGVVLRDVLKLAENMKEAKKILNSSLVKVDGVVRKDRRFPVGLMDVVAVGSEYYRILPGKKGLYLHRMSEDERRIKLSKVINKTCISGKYQLNLHDGKNMIAGNDCRTGDVLVIDTDSNEIKQVLNFRKGSVALITGGSNAGSTGKIEEIIVARSSQPNQIVIKSQNERLIVPAGYVYVVGIDKPVISLPGE